MQVPPVGDSSPSRGPSAIGVHCDRCVLNRRSDRIVQDSTHGSCSYHTVSGSATAAVANDVQTRCTAVAVWRKSCSNHTAD